MAVRSALLLARDLRTSKLQSGYEASLRLRSAATLARRGWTFASRIGQGGMQPSPLNEGPGAGLAINYSQRGGVAPVMIAVWLTLTPILSPALTVLALAVLAIGGLL